MNGLSARLHSSLLSWPFNGGDVGVTWSQQEVYRRACNISGQRQSLKNIPWGILIMIMGCCSPSRAHRLLYAYLNNRGLCSPARKFRFTYLKHLTSAGEWPAEAHYVQIHSTKRQTPSAYGFSVWNWKCWSTFLIQVTLAHCFGA